MIAKEIAVDIFSKRNKQFGIVVERICQWDEHKTMRENHARLCELSIGFIDANRTNSFARRYSLKYLREKNYTKKWAESKKLIVYSAIVDLIDKKWSYHRVGRLLGLHGSLVKCIKDEGPVYFDRMTNDVIERVVSHII